MERNMPHSWEESVRKLKWMKRIEGPVGLRKAKRDFPRPKARDSRSGSRRQPRGGQLTSRPQIKGYILLIATDGHRLKYSRGFGQATFYGGSRRSYCAPDFEESWVSSCLVSVWSTYPRCSWRGGSSDASCWHPVPLFLNLNLRKPCFSSIHIVNSFLDGFTFAPEIPTYIFCSVRKKHRKSWNDKTTRASWGKPFRILQRTLSCSSKTTFQPLGY